MKSVVTMAKSMDTMSRNRWSRCRETSGHHRAKFARSIRTSRGSSSRREVRGPPHPKHGSWLNVAEIFLSTLSSQRLDQRIGSIIELHTTVSAWRASRPHRKVNWRFTTADARIRLRRLYPSIP